MARKILTYGGYFESFMATLKEKEQEKIQYGLLLLKTQERLPKKFVKLICNGIYELRTEYAGKFLEYFSSLMMARLSCYLMDSRKRLRKRLITKLKKQ